MCLLSVSECVQQLWSEQPMSARAIIRLVQTVCRDRVAVLMVLEGFSCLLHPLCMHVLWEVQPCFCHSHLFQMWLLFMLHHAMVELTQDDWQAWLSQFCPLPRDFLRFPFLLNLHLTWYLSYSVCLFGPLFLKLWQVFSSLGLEGNR